MDSKSDWKGRFDMNIVEITTHGKVGSVSRIIDSIINTNAKLKRNNVFKLFYGRDDKSFDNIHIKFESKIEVYIHAILARFFDADGKFSYFATKRLINYISEYDPQIVHLHCLHGYFLNYKLLFKYFYEKQIKVIWTFHDCWSFTGHCAYFTNENCMKWKKECFCCLNKKKYPKSILFDRSKSNYLNKKNVFTMLDENQMIIITPSEWLSNLVKESFLKKYSIRVIHNGINLNSFYFKENAYDELNIVYQLNNKKVILGVANVWDERKGLYDFFELSKMITSNYIIVLIGLTDKQINTLPKNILGLKKTQNISELVMWYSACYLFFNPTKEDNYPTVNLEAQACCASVFSYDIGGCSETLFGNSRIIKSVNELYEIIKKEKIEKNILSENERDNLNEESKFIDYLNLFDEVIK